jgi:hypothetical protein
LQDTAVRFAYTRSLAGASLDQSHQIEPSQVAGFIQNYRSVIPESIAGGNAGAGFETFDLSLEQKFRTGTYLAISGEILNSTVNRIAGAFDYNPFSFALPNPAPSGMRENLDYQEKSLQFTANQLLGRGWALGAKYRVSEAVLNDNFADVPDGILFGNFQPRQRTRGTLQQADLTAIYNHRCGFFAGGGGPMVRPGERRLHAGRAGQRFLAVQPVCRLAFPAPQGRAVHGPAQHCRAGLPAQPAQHLQRTPTLAHPGLALAD